MGRPGIYIPNPGALEDLLSSDEAVQAVVDAAEAGKARAQEIQKDRTGAHDDRIFAGGVEIAATEQGGPKVAICHFGSFAGTWHLMEYGSAHNPPFRPLTQAAEQVGLDFRPE